jgi:penicillin-binding protein 2
MAFFRISFLSMLAGLVLLGPSLMMGAAPKKPVAAKKATKKTVVAKKSSAAKPVLAAKRTPQKGNATKVSLSAQGKNKKVSLRSASVSRFRQRNSPYAGFWTTPNFADSTEGDVIDGEDLTVRRAAVEALNGMNGTVVVADPSTGRILSIVNQKLALQNGFQPCSTIKILASLAGVMEGQFDRDKVLKLGRRDYMNMTDALARSNNPYFAQIGRTLGYDKINYYAKLMGLGEQAGLNIPGEKPGTWPSKEVPSGIGMMTSFGDGIDLTPLQLASMVGTIANGGTMYYLQYPRTQAEIEMFQPQVKRRIEKIDTAIPEIKPGMQGAIDFGSARRAGYDSHEPIYGKTGTCTHSDHKTHLGWFGSFNEVGDRKLVVVVLLTGGKLVSGPVASGVGGQVFRRLNEQRYFTANPQVAALPPLPFSPLANPLANLLPIVPEN